MPMESVKSILQKAEKGNFGVVSFLCFNQETIKWAIEAAEEESMPVIIMMYPGLSNLMSFEVFAAVTRTLAETAMVPVGLHLDHSNSADVILKSMRVGFPSVMIDGSSLEFEKNVQITADVVRAAHPMGVDVEAELGHVGTASNPDDYLDSSCFTDPGKAAEFVERTGVDSLAVAFGNAHGAYVSTPNLDIGLLKRLRAAVGVPLVLHGGTGIPDEQIKEAVRHGIRKMNVGTALFSTWTKAMEDYVATPGPHNVFQFLSQAERAMKNEMRGRIEALIP